MRVQNHHGRPRQELGHGHGSGEFHGGSEGDRTGTGLEKASLAAASAAQTRTGYVVGGISPLGQKNPSPTLLDESARELATVLVSGGQRGLDVELSPSDLLRLTDGRYAPLAA